MGLSILLWTQIFAKRLAKTFVLAKLDLTHCLSEAVVRSDVSVFGLVYKFRYLLTYRTFTL